MPARPFGSGLHCAGKNMIAVSAITLALYLASIVRDELGAVPQPVQHLFSDFLMHTFPVPANLTVTTTTASTSSPTPMPTQTTTLPPPEPGRLDVLQLHVPKNCGRGQSLRTQLLTGQPKLC